MHGQKATNLLPGVLVLCYGGLFLIWLLFKAGTADRPEAGIHAFLAGSAGISLYLSLSGFKMLRRQSGSLRWVSLLLSIGLLFNTLGQALSAAFALPFFAHFPLPFLPDLLFICGYPFFLGSVLLFPSQRLSATIRARLAADGLLIILALVTLSWYFIIGPSIFHQQGSLAAQLFAAAYPFADLVLLCCLVLITTKQSSINRGLFLLLIPLTAGLVLFVLTDSIDAYLILHHLPQSIFENLGWFWGYLLLGIAWPVGRVRKDLEGEAAIENPSWIRSLFPYTFVVLILLLACWIWIRGEAGIVASVACAGALLLVGVVLLRQLFALKTVYEVNRQLALLSATDSLTGLPNHRTLLEHLETEIERARRFNHPLSVVFFDGDRFKQINDTYGHRAGDAVLRELGARVRNILRAGDILGRYGGEEFLIILSESDTEQAVAMAERVREAVATLPLATDYVEGGINVTISMGIAAYPTDGTTGSQVLERADQAMYLSKRLGRNQVRTGADIARAGQNEALEIAIPDHTAA